MKENEQQTNCPQLGKDFERFINFFSEASVSGQEAIPSKGPFLIVIPHARKEHYLMGRCLPEPPLDALLASKLIEKRTEQLIRWMMASAESVAVDLPPLLQKLIASLWERATNRYGGIPVPLDKKRAIERGKAAREAINCLLRGEIVGIALTSERKLTRATAEEGAAYIALGASKKIDQPITVLLVSFNGLECGINLFLRRKNPVNIAIKPLTIQFDPNKSLKRQVEILTTDLFSLLSQEKPDKDDKL